MHWLLAQADARRLPLPDKSVDLVCGSPPYDEARTYQDGTLPKGRRVAMSPRRWVDWMLLVTAESLRVSRGPVVWVACGTTKDRTYRPICEGLAWRWYDEGWTERGPGTAKDGSAYRPVAWTKNGQPGSGADQWYRSDWEFCLCFKRPGPLPWADNKACGEAPKYKPGGELCHRMKSGRRVDRLHTKRMPVGSMEVQGYVPPDTANPGNVLHVKVGGGRLGSRLAHDNEAPFPEGVPERFILSLCPPGGVVLDPFSGSATTAAVAVRHGRRAIGLDLRSSQCDLGVRRLLEPPRTPKARKGKSRPAMPEQRRLFS